MDLSVYKKLHQFKRLYLTHIVITGGMKWIGLCMVAILLALWIESQFWLPQLGRAMLYFTCLSVATLSSLVWVLYPLWRDFKRLGPEQIAQHIGTQLPSVSDTLLNYVQLTEIATHNALAQHELLRRAQGWKGLKFHAAIPWRKTRPLLYYVLPIVGLFIALLSIQPRWLSNSAERLVHYNQTFIKPLPFGFKILNPQPLHAFKQEPFVLHAQLIGENLPTALYLLIQDRRIPLTATEPNTYTYTLQGNIDEVFHLEAGGYRSPSYTLLRVQRPVLQKATLQLTYPKYTQLPPETWNELRSVRVPEGTYLEWRCQSSTADSVLFTFAEQTQKATKQEAQDTKDVKEAHIFALSRQFLQSTQYDMLLYNEHGAQKELLQYEVLVDPDQSPQIFAKTQADTVLYRQITIGGYALDDYGIRQVRVRYRHISQTEGVVTRTWRVGTRYALGKKQATFFVEWPLDSLQLQPGDQLQYRIEAQDNDRVRGPKQSATPWFALYLPTEEAQAEHLDEKTTATISQLENSQQAHANLLQELDDLQERLRTQTSINWNDIQEMQKLQENKKDLEEAISSLEEDRQLLEQQRERLSSVEPDLQEKIDKLNALFEKLLDDETRKLYQDLDKLMQQNRRLPQIQKQLEKIQSQEELLAMEYEKAKSLLEQLAFSLRMEQLKEQIERMQEAQAALAEQTKESRSKEERAAIGEKQAALKEALEALEEDFEALAERFEELPNQNKDDLTVPSPDPSVGEHMQSSQDALEQNKPQQAASEQQQASDKLQKLKESLASFAQSMGKQQKQIDIERVTRLLDDLIQLSIEEEQIEGMLGAANQSLQQQDLIAKQQYDLQLSAKAVLDSVAAFARTSFEIDLVINETLTALSLDLAEALTLIRDRMYAQSKVKAYESMASFNKLALLLHRILEQAQQQSGMQGQGSGESGGVPSMANWQQQLREQIQELQQGPKQGGEAFSQELVEMIAQQERIRRALQEATSDQLGSAQDKKALRKLIQDMEDTERALANKQFDRQLLQKQQTIHSRLLEVEKSLREQDEKNEREGQQAGSYVPVSPEALGLFQTPTPQTIEALKKANLPLERYYKQEVERYFRRLKETDRNSG